jgi:ABC-type nitrate/sulfonate/bicarbonate transport system substrate-binding protein
MDASSTRREVFIGGSVALALASGSLHEAAAQGPTPLKVTSFPGLSNYPIFAAQHKDWFVKEGISVDLVYTPNSKTQREGLARNDFQIIHTAADNAVASGHRSDMFSVRLEWLTHQGCEYQVAASADDC